MAEKKQKKEAQEQAPVVIIDELLPQLSNKNSDYVFKLRKFVKEAGATDAQEQAILVEFLPKILKDQHEGKPAAQVYGAPSVLADHILKSPGKKQGDKQPFWIETADLGFSFLAIFAIIYGAMSFFRKNASQDASGGFLSLLLMSFFAAFIFTYFNRWMDMDKKKRPNAFLIAIAGIASVLVVSLVSVWLTANVDTIFTRQLPAIAQFVLAAVAYGCHFFLKRHFHLRNLFQAVPKARK